MEHRSLGRTGITVSPLCLGAMMFGAWGNPDHDDCVRIVHAALDAGINFIDTADVYSAGESEQIVGKALAGGRRDDVVLATKFYAPMGEGPNKRGSSRRWIMHECEASLRRLGTDWIDLYQVHRPDPAVDVDEELIALADEAGLSLIHLALGFVLEHPAVTSAIVGPRTMEHLEGQLGAADVVLDDKVLDRIDELVPPGTNLNEADAGWTPPALADASLRRRRSGRNS